MTGGADARAEVLGRIRGALGGGVAVPEVPRSYRGPGAIAGEGVVDRFCERVAEYRAQVRRVTASEVPAAVREILAEAGRIGVPAGFDDLGLDVVADDPPLSVADLDGLDAVVTGCALAIAETGTIVLDGGPRSGRRALTLVPDWHVCVVEAGSVVAGVPDAIAALGPAVADGRPITFVSGPSATSDIELDRVEGVHGPRTLDVLLVDSPGGGR